MNIVDLSQVKQRIKRGGSSVEDDDILLTLIEAVSATIESHLNRGLEKKARTEQFDVDPRQEVFSLYAYPNITITTVWNDSLWGFADASIVSSSWYNTHAGAGQLIFQGSTLAAGRGALKVTYTGGIAVDTDDFLLEHADIAEAAIRQVVADFNRTPVAGQASVTAIGGGGLSFTHTGKLLPDVKSLLEPHIRYVFR